MFTRVATGDLLVPALGQQILCRRRLDNLCNMPDPPLDSDLGSRVTGSVFAQDATSAALTTNSRAPPSALLGASPLCGTSAIASKPARCSVGRRRLIGLRSRRRASGQVDEYRSHFLEHAASESLLPAERGLMGFGGLLIVCPSPSRLDITYAAYATNELSRCPMEEDCANIKHLCR